MKTPLQAFATLFTGLLAMSSLAVAGNGALLDVTIAYPVINFQQGGASQGAVYNGTQLIITATAPNMIFTPMGAVEVIGGGAVALTASISPSGAFTGGTFTISGTVVDTGTATTYSSPLLTGTVEDYGIIDVASTDFVDFRLKATGGSLLSRVGGTSATIGLSAALQGSTFTGTFVSNWAADNVVGQVGPAPSTLPFPCFNVSSVKIKNRSGTTNDEVHISKGGVRLPTGTSFNPATDNVQVTVDGLVVNIPAGSFVKSGNKPDFTFNTASGVTPKIQMRIDLEKNTWEFDLTKGDVALVSTSNGVKVTLQIGVYTGTQTVAISGHHNSSEDGSSHPPSCKLSGNSSDSATPGVGKLSSITGLTLQTPHGKYVKKARSQRGISHPNTVYVDDVDGDFAIVNTSGGTCLKCGDVVSGTSGHAFTIMEIQGRPSDTLARTCGVYNASCNILPPGVSGEAD
jgi:hypothetical protein